jgi:hypothetical protein
MAIGSAGYLKTFQNGVPWDLFLIFDYLKKKGVFKKIWKCSFFILGNLFF